MSNSLKLILKKKMENVKQSRKLISLMLCLIREKSKYNQRCSLSENVIDY